MLRARNLGIPAALTGGLCQVAGDHPACIGADARMQVVTADALAEDVNGNLWIGGPNQVIRWRDGTFDAYLREQLQGFVQSTSSMTAAPDGSVYAAIPRGPTGLYRFGQDGVPSRVSFQGVNTTEIVSVFVDRDRSLWMGTFRDGVYRMHGQRMEHFRSEHGLSSKRRPGLFRGPRRESLVATSRGLDCFRESPVVPFSTTEGIASSTVQSVLASHDGTVWIGGMGSLDALRGDDLTSIPVQNRSVTALLQDHASRLWAGVGYTLAVYENGRFNTINRLDGSPVGMVAGIVEDREQNVWVSVDVGTASRKLLRIRDQRVQEQLGPDRVPLVRHLAADPTGGVWLGFEDGNLGHYKNGTLEVFPLPRAPDSPASVTHADVGYLGLTIDSDGSAWVATWRGLVRWKQREMKTLTTRNGLPCDQIVSAIRDAHATLWLYTKCGFLAITDAELERWWQRPDRVIHVEVLDALDGAALPAGPRRSQPSVSKSPDGRLWFVNGAVLQMIDPDGLRKDPRPPPVYVEQVTADHTEYGVAGLVRLPARSRDIEISYTAPSFSAPQKIRFRYKLDPRDQELARRRHAPRGLLQRLAPGRYRFHVAASNTDGVWSETGAALDLSIAHAYYQTTWFRTGMVVCVLGLLWTAYHLRLRQLSATFEGRLQERLNERTRIARELHDTLLQSFHGVMFRFQAAANVLPDRPLEARQRLEIALKHGTHAIREGRDAVQGLRASTTVTNDLAAALSALGKELATTSIDDTPAEAAALDVAIHGSPRALRPIIRDDIYRIAGEALRNAFRHARAGRIEVEIRYDERQFQLRVRDDGRGFESVALEDHRAGHFGLPGMHERAEMIGGQLEVWSETGMGTEVALAIPAAAVYTSPQSRRHFWPFVGRTNS
jgi:signal transduction histidine kinase/ligand-binding sensor domain-containing protein